MTRLEQALALAARGFWIFPLRQGEKNPAVKSWPSAATRSEKRIQSWWKNGPERNIGIATEKFGDDKALVVVDVDVKGGKDGNAELFRLELEGHELPATLTQSTPSGGSHLIYVADAPLKQGVDTLGVGLDIRSRGGYIVGAGSALDSGEYTINDAPLAQAPQWLVNLLGVDRRAQVTDASPLPRVDAQRALKRGVAYLAAAPLALEGAGGDSTTYRVAAELKDTGCTEAQALELLLGHWNDRCSPPWGPDELATKVRNAYKHGKEPPGIDAPEAVFEAVIPAEVESNDAKHPFDTLNQEHAFVVAGGGHILWETTDPQGRAMLMHVDMTTFHTKFAAQKFQAGDKFLALTKAWIEWPGRRTYDGFVFAPGRAVDTRWYNLWRGFSVEPAETGNHPMVARFLEHALNNVCGGDKELCRWLIGYFAHMIQRPWEKPLTALVFKGKKGTGKNALVERVGKLLGGAFLLTSKRRYLVSNFNGHFENCLLLTLDEAFWSGDKESEGILKDLVTGAEHNIEHKGKESYKVANLTRVIIIGNEEWLVPASHDERRYAVFTMGDGRIQDRNYFHDMRVGLDDEGGNAHLLRYLLDFDLEGIDVNAAPSTQGLIDQKHASLEPVQQWWHDCLLEGQLIGGDFGGEWPERTPTNRLRDAFQRYANKRNIRGRLPDQASIGRILRDIAPSLKHAKCVRENPADSSYSYFNPGIDVLRADWERHIGGVVPWGER